MNMNDIFNVYLSSFFMSIEKNICIVLLSFDGITHRSPAFLIPDDFMISNEQNDQFM